VYGKASLKGAWLSQVNHLNFGGHNHIPGTADRLRRCQLISPVSVVNFWRTSNWKHAIKYDVYVNFPRIFAHNVQICAKFSCKNFTDVCLVFWILRHYTWGRFFVNTLYLHTRFHLDTSNRLAIVHKRYRQTDRQTDRQTEQIWQRSDSIGRTVLQTVAQKLLVCLIFIILSLHLVFYLIKPQIL